MGPSFWAPELVVTTAQWLGAGNKTLTGQNGDPLGAKISKRYSSYKSQPKVFKLFLNFLPNGPHKSMFGISEIWKIEILTNFIRFR